MRSPAKRQASARSASQIRTLMFIGYSEYVTSFTVQDEFGVEREMVRADFDGFEGIQVIGPLAELVRSGAPIANPAGSDIA